MTPKQQEGTGQTNTGLSTLRRSLCFTYFISTPFVLFPQAHQVVWICRPGAIKSDSKAKGKQVSGENQQRTSQHFVVRYKSTVLNSIVAKRSKRRHGDEPAFMPVLCFTHDYNKSVNFLLLQLQISLNG